MHLGILWWGSHSEVPKIKFAWSTYRGDDIWVIHHPGLLLHEREDCIGDAGHSVQSALHRSAAC